MTHFGIVARIAMIVTAAMVISQVAVLLSYLWQIERSPLPPFAVANRIAAVVRLLDRTAAEDMTDVLAVASVEGFHVSVLSHVPATFEDQPSTARMRVMVQRIIDGYSPDRLVRSGQVDPVRDESVAAIDFAVELGTGDVAMFSISDDTTLRLFNIPLGFLAGLFGIAVAVIAVLAVARETRPLARLSKSIDELGNRIQPIEVKEVGARELRTLIRAVNNMQERIFGLVGNRTLLLGAISHDLKTYLTRFRLRLEMMPESKHRDRAVTDVDAMEQLLDDALLFAGDAYSNAKIETIDLNIIVDHCVSDTNMQTGLVSFAATSVPLEVCIPERALRRVIDNLISNALRYGEHASITTEKKNGAACIVIEDDGPGIPPSDLSLVFEPFFRGEPSRNRAHGGSGLGLSIVRQILDAYGGTITLSNRPEAQGLSAAVCLPLANGPEAHHHLNLTRAG
ncbi:MULTISPECIES: ATP-binding protein [unclassified Agrobacterium]|uniref:ATP-binding protein n=2 Tax=Agrobacterium TaxID=357 RepID=UPI00244826D0|nr:MULTISPECIES: ATP-binding protein [unclassified Agrobacterium]MDH0617022.1 ATP-binding protein [Agrobacterium sp. GD03872]MDH0699780.1 ATP-binding protein [Agrobacterium sp. GD03871]MDH1061026.1 ATP-binding protein [Agrobacterium sp. GD03992]MDH2211558.1 ATP-binding protein [Agrobacterium sp. GD03643]MDH2221195.1 ATP-binding protein [Agrobacterium sp. GD03638]